MKETGSSDQKSLLRFGCDTVDQFLWWFLDLCTKSLKVASEKVAQLPRRDEHPLVISIQFATVALTKLLVENVFSTWTKNGFFR